MKNMKTSFKLINLLSFIFSITLISKCYPLKYSIDLPHNIFDNSNIGDLWHPHLKKIQRKDGTFKIIDIRNVVASLSLIQIDDDVNQKLKKENVSFLQVSEPSSNSNGRNNVTPKMKCGCKFIKQNDKFLMDNLKALENTDQNANNSGGVSMSFIEKHHREYNNNNKEATRDSNTKYNKNNNRIQKTNPNFRKNDDSMKNPYAESQKIFQQLDMVNTPSSGLPKYNVIFQPSKPQEIYDNKNDNTEKKDKYQEQINQLKEKMNENTSILNKIENLLEKRPSENNFLSQNNANNPIASQVLNPQGNYSYLNNLGNPNLQAFNNYMNNNNNQIPVIHAMNPLNNQFTYVNNNPPAAAIVNPIQGNYNGNGIPYIPQMISNNPVVPMLQNANIPLMNSNNIVPLVVGVNRF